MADIPDINQFIGSEEISGARDRANQAAQRAVNYQSAAGQLPSKLRKAIQENVDYNKDIITEQNEAAANYFAAPSVAREKYQNVWNPFEREKLVTQYRGQEYAPYASLTDILGERRGHIDEIVGAGVGAFQSQVAAQQGSANLARQNYQDQLQFGQLQYGGAIDAYNSQISAAGAGGGGGVGAGAGAFDFTDMPGYGNNSFGFNLGGQTNGGGLRTDDRGSLDDLVENDLDFSNIPQIFSGGGNVAGRSAVLAPRQEERSFIDNFNIIPGQTYTQKYNLPLSL